MHFTLPRASASRPQNLQIMAPRGAIAVGVLGFVQCAKARQLSCEGRCAMSIPGFAWLEQHSRGHFIRPVVDCLPQFVKWR